jgi:phage-related protein
MKKLPKCKPVDWVGPSKKELLEFPEEVIDSVGKTLFGVQLGMTLPNCKPLKGFGGAGVLEIKEDFDVDTYRTVYTVIFAEVIYVLHCFQKKSKSGIATPKKNIDVIRQRLKQAQEDWRANYEK